MMWMMGYNDGIEFSSIPDSFNARKLRPTRHLLNLNHHLAAMAELSTQQVVVSSRWNPTPEQLQALEELYTGGTRTPSADQIQHITAQLRRYGKIEGKNVFYWFQNHKARERQKRRRQLQSPSPNSQTEDGQKNKESLQGANGTIFEEESKNWVSPTNSSTIAEKNVSTQGAVKAADAGCKSDGWLQFDELQQRRNATWQMMPLSCSSSPTNLFPPPVTSCTVPTNLIKKHHFIHDIFLQPYNVDHSADSGGEAQTLQLFPVGRGGCGCDDVKEEEDKSGAAAINATINVTSHQFFQFLPLKN